MIRLATFSFTCALATSAIAGPVDATRALFSGECVRPLVEETTPNVDGFYVWNDQEIAQLAEQLGMQPEVFSFWTPESTKDILIWSDTDPVCQVIQIGYTTDTVQAIWPGIEADPEFRGKPNSNSSSGAQMEGFGVIRAKNNEFVQITMQFQDFGQPGATLTMLTAVRVGPNSAACELFPEECN